MTTVSAAITLFLLIDPLGNAPIFLSVLGKLDEERRRRAIVREAFFALAILLTFLFFGNVILSSLRISTPALATAGGVVLFLVALRMIFPGRYGAIADENNDDDPWLAPLATPLIAGPSSMAWVMLLSSQDPKRMMDWTVAVVAACAVGTAILLLANALRRFIKDRVMRLMERLMGTILVVVAVQMAMDGVARYLDAPPPALSSGASR